MSNSFNAGRDRVNHKATSSSAVTHLGRSDVESSAFFSAHQGCIVLSLLHDFTKWASACYFAILALMGIPSLAISLFGSTETAHAWEVELSRVFTIGMVIAVVAGLGLTFSQYHYHRRAHR